MCVCVFVCTRVFQPVNSTNRQLFFPAFSQTCMEATGYTPNRGHFRVVFNYNMRIRRENGDERQRTNSSSELSHGHQVNDLFAPKKKTMHYSSKRIVSHAYILITMNVAYLGLINSRIYLKKNNFIQTLPKTSHIVTLNWIVTNECKPYWRWTYESQPIWATTKRSQREKNQHTRIFGSLLRTN